MSPVQAQIEIFLTAFRALPAPAQHEILDRLRHAVIAEPAQNAAALNLLRTWMADESGYDEQTWPTLKQTMEANRLSDRSLFDDSDASTPDAR